MAAGLAPVPSLLRHCVWLGMQPDYFNCGIFPLLLSRCLHHNVKISRRWTSEDLDAQRDVITLELMKGRVLTFIG